MSPADGTAKEDLPPARFWAQRGLEAYDHKIFEGEKLDYETLKNTASFLYASKQIYAMRNGETWEQKCTREHLDPNSQAAKDKLGDYGISTVRWFNNNTYSTARLAYEMANKATDEQKVAALYLIQSYEHTKMSWSGAFSALGQGVIDPVNVASIGLGAVSGGTATAAIQAARTGGTVALRTVMVDAARSLATRQAAKWIAGAALEGAAGNMLQNHFQQSVNTTSFNAGGNAYQAQHSYSVAQLAFAGGTGAVVGGGLGVAGHGLGAANRYVKGNWFHGGPGSLGNGYIDAAGRTALGSRWQTVTNAFGGNAATPNVAGVAPNPATTVPLNGTVGQSGINLPKFETRTDYFKLLMRRNLNPFLGFTNWAPVTSMPIESRPITTRVIRAVDAFMSHSDSVKGEKSIVEGIRSLQQNFLNELGGKGVAKGDGSAAMTAFVTDYAGDLARFQTGIKELRQHVIDTHDVVGPIRSGTLGAATHAIPGLAGDYGKTGLTAGQMKALVKYLDDMDKLADDLLKGAGSKNFQEMKDSFARGLANDPESLNGLSSAFFQANNAMMRHTGKTWKGEKVSVQWNDALARMLQEEYYTGAHPSEAIGYNYARGAENIEMTWQNNILEFPEKHLATKDKDGKITNFTWDSTKITNFFGQLEAVERRGFGQEALYAMDELMRRRHMWGGGDRNTLPSASEFRRYFQTQPKYMELDAAGKPNANFSQSYKDWVDAMISKADVNDTEEKGAAMFLFGRFLNNRQNRHYYANKTYPYRMSMRHAGTREDVWRFGLALPGFNYWSPRVMAVPKQTISYFLGAKEAKIVNNLVESGNVSGAYPKLSVIWKGEGESGLRVAGRAALRIASGGAIDDLTWKIWKIPSTMGYRVYAPLIGAGLLYDWSQQKEFKLEDYEAYHVWQTMMIPPKTIWGGVSGWAGSWNQGNGFWNTGGLTGAGSGFSSGVADVYNTTFAGMTIPFTGHVLQRAGDSQQPGQTGDTSQTGTGSGSAASSELTPEKRDQMEQEKTALRVSLRGFGKEVADLTNALAADNNWDAPSAIAGVTRRARVTQLVDLQKKFVDDIKKYELGAYAEAINNDAYNALTYQLVPNEKTKGKPQTVPSWDDREKARTGAILRPFTQWYNGLIAVNKEVQTNGWTPANKKAINDLAALYGTFSKDLPFMPPDTEAKWVEAYRWHLAMHTQANSPDPAFAGVTPITATPITVPEIYADGTPAGRGQPGGGERQPAGQGRPGGSPDPEAIAAEAAERKRQEEADAAAHPNETPEQRTERIEKERIARERAGNGANDPNAGAANPDASTDTGGSTPRRRRPADDRSWWETFTDTMGVEGEDGVTTLVNKTGTALGGAAVGFGGMMKNTFNRLMNKKDGSGRALIREAGAGIISLIAMGAAVGPLLDKLGIGKVPIIGSLAKIAALVVVFMVARKGIDSFMEPAPARTPTGPTDGVAQQEPGGGRNYPTLLSGQRVDTQSSAGELKRIFTIGDEGDKDPVLDEIMLGEKAGKPVLQVRTDNGQTYVSLGVVGDDVVQTAKAKGQALDIPSALLGDKSGRIASQQFEAVTSDKIGADSFTMTIDGKNHVFRLDQNATFAELSPN